MQQFFEQTTFNAQSKYNHKVFILDKTPTDWSIYHNCCVIIHDKPVKLTYPATSTQKKELFQPPPRLYFVSHDNITNTQNVSSLWIGAFSDHHQHDTTSNSKSFINHILPLLKDKLTAGQSSIVLTNEEFIKCISVYAGFHPFCEKRFEKQMSPKAIEGHVSRNASPVQMRLTASPVDMKGNDNLILTGGTNGFA
jgi:hypothetical protein